MNELHKLFAEALAQSGLEVAALDESDLRQLLQSKIIPECATSTLDELRQRAPDMLRERRAMEGVSDLETLSVGPRDSIFLRC